MFWRKKKKPQTDFTCSECGQVHSGWPALAYNSPAFYHDLTPEQKASNAELNSDFCVVEIDNETSYFIRVTLFQKVADSDEMLEYGLWASLSEKSYKDYCENYSDENQSGSYFGWLANDLPEYELSGIIPTNVNLQNGNQRPEMVPHTGTNHQFVIDYYEGISSHEAQRRVDDMVKTLRG
jgi:hypothetical protein